MALRVASRVAPVVRWEELGVLALLSSVPVEAASMQPDVLRVRDAAGAAWGLDTLAAVVRTESSRAASAVLGLHHSTVQSRQARLEELLGFKLSTAAAARWRRSSSIG